MNRKIVIGILFAVAFCASIYFVPSMTETRERCDEFGGFKEYEFLASENFENTYLVCNDGTRILK